MSPKPTGRGFGPKYCFVAGTLVATKTGLRLIEEIEMGEYVWSRDQATGEVAVLSELCPHLPGWESDDARR